MMATIFDGLSWICLLAGGFFVLVGGIGLIRLPDFFTRLHAAGITDTMGAGLILLGLALQSGFGLVAIKLLLFFGFLIFGDFPDLVAIFGMLIIVTSGLYVALGHRFKARDAPETPVD